MTCRGCGRPSRQRMFSLGDVPSVNTFLSRDELTRERPYPLDVAFCRECFLVQLEDIAPPAELFSTYQHLSGASQSNVRHLESLAQRLPVEAGSKVMEIGCNDGTLLAALKSRTPHVLGVDPAQNLAAYAQRKGVEVVTAFFDRETAARVVKERGPQNVVVAINVVAHTPDVNGLLAAVSAVLAPDGMFVMEAVDVSRTILRGEFDTVYHEHVYCFSLTALVPLLARAGLTVVDVEALPTQGGSLRVFSRRTDAKPKVAPSVAAWLSHEAAQGIARADTYERVGEQVRAFKPALLEQLNRLKQKHGRVFGLGAPARGVVILNFCGIGPDLLDAVVDDTPLKQGRLVPGVHVPVVDWQAVAERQPGGFLLLSWNYENEVLSKLRQRVSSGEVLVPFPQLRTVELK